MKFVILIHSNPRPWAHPTCDHTPEYQALPQEKQDELGAHWERVFGEADANGEVVYGCPLGAPEAARVFHFDEQPLPTDGPYAEGKEHLAGFFLIDVETQERAEQIAAAFSCPGDTVELRPVMTPGCHS
ncbi:YciI family protein [Janibacter sp. GXQ6167]|uniref:YciI family protein n=1 Tax=Janibacter sp. GXQ6167 TaxID=3240791 RepID=UPI0035260A3C